MKKLPVLLLILPLLLFAGEPLHAHEPGKTRATAHFAPDGTYTIDVAVDPAALLAKLQILAGQSPTPDVPARDFAPRIEALRDMLLANVQVTFDGIPDRPSLAIKETAEDASPSPDTPPSPPDSVQHGKRGAGSVRGFRLTGRVPPAARSFRFAYDLVLGAFPLTVDGKTVWLTGGQLSEAFPLAGGGGMSRLRVARQYLVLGFEHIVPKGLDHILFVLGIFLLGTAWRPVLWQVTTFTIAHSITLGLTIYGVVSLPSSIVEPLIALSICYVAVENLFTATLTPWRVGLVFAFGLLHGMGFAGVLRELGLPRSEFLTALVTFNLGVEAGQLAVIGTAMIFVAWLGSRAWWRRPASCAIAAVGAYWTIVRVFYA
jgi:hypothetical protein